MTRKKMMDFKEWYDEDKQELLTESFVESEANMHMNFSEYRNMMYQSYFNNNKDWWQMFVYVPSLSERLTMVVFMLTGENGMCKLFWYAEHEYAIASEDVSVGEFV